MKLTFLVLIALAICSCKQNVEAEVKTAPSQKKEIAKISKDLNETKETVAITFKTETATQVHQAYLELKGALVNTDAKEAATAASDFIQMLSTLEKSAVVIRLSKDLEVIAASQEAGVQRATFEEISKKVETYLVEEIATGTLIKQYCPMAFDGKGAYWLSDSKEVRNPYFGNVMLTCGVVDKEIK